jgi:P4 family phage/plasmid primase-like protien
MKQNLFALAKNISLDELKGFAEKHGGEFGREGRATNRNECFCPFHAHEHDTPSLHFKQGKDAPFWHCFACNAGGDVVKWAELYLKLKPLEACEAVLDYFAVPYEKNGEGLSDERKAEIEKAQEARSIELGEQQEKIQKEAARERQRYSAMMEKDAPRLKENFTTMRESIEGEIGALFPNFNSYLADWADVYLGYDSEHRSIAIINQYHDKIHNIKWRNKYKWDGKKLTEERLSGKWIGVKSTEAFPFPLAWSEASEERRVIICEGEKDALNLLSYGVNCLTLGACTNSWEKYKVLLKEKEVYVWFDNDEAGYRGAVSRYMELKDACADIYIVPFFSFKGNLPQKYDISDYLARHSIKNADEIYEAITYSCFKLTNDILNSIEELYGIDLGTYKEVVRVKDFRDIVKDIMATDEEGKYKNIIKVKGELADSDMDAVFAKIKKLGPSEVFDAVKIATAEKLEGDSATLKKIEEVVNVFHRALNLRTQMLNDYQKTHTVDIVSALYGTLKKTGYDTGEYRGSIHFWEGTHYLKVDKNHLTKFIHTSWMRAAYVDKKKQLKDMADETYNNLLSLSHNLNIIKENEERRVINFLNGTLFISKKGRYTFKEKHDKKDAAINILDFKYDAKARALKWEKFLKRALPDEKDRMALMEFIGYCFLPSHEYETFLFLYGKSGSNGKSVILDTIRTFIGFDNVSFLQMQQFEGHQLEAITGKILNIGSEIDKNAMSDGQLATIKTLVSNNEPIQIDPKNRLSYTLRPNEKPKLAFSGNNKPKAGMDDGVFRRMLLLTFDEEIGDDEKIRDLSERFKDEMAGILNLALVGLIRLKTNGRFTRSERAKEELDQYKDEVNPVRGFVKSAIVGASGYCVPTECLYRLYQIYCARAGRQAPNINTFIQKVKEELIAAKIEFDTKQITIKELPKGLGTNRPRVITDIAINKDFEITDFTASDKDGTIVSIKEISLYIGAKKTELF